MLQFIPTIPGRTRFSRLMLLCAFGAFLALEAAAQSAATLALQCFTAADSVRSFLAVVYDANGKAVDSAAATGNTVQFFNLPTSIRTLTERERPAGFALGQNYPNPFNPTTRIRVQLGRAEDVELRIFNLLGKTEAVFSGTLGAGVHEFEWRSNAAAGVYFYRLTAGGFAETRKMVKIDGGGSGGSGLAFVGSGGMPLDAGAESTEHPLLRKTEGIGYSVRVRNVLRTNPQVFDTVVTQVTLTRDTVLSLVLRAAPQTILIPVPSSMNLTGGSFVLTGSASVYVDPASAEMLAVAAELSAQLARATGFALPVLPLAGTPPAGSIVLTLTAPDTALGGEGYRLTVEPDRVTLSASAPAGIFYGIQTMRQMLPPSIENCSPLAGPWRIQTGVIADKPRFGWRGAMLDVSRHFFGVNDVKRVMDLLAYFKLNTLHLHLSDDQGWRIMINSWPALASVGGASDIGNGGGGWYTQAQYADLLAYARSRYLTIIPELEIPGHFSAALKAYPQLSSGGPYWKNSLVFIMLDDVFRELAVMTPGPYIHVGGDEAYEIPLNDYIVFVDSVQTIVRRYGKDISGWADIGDAHLKPGSIVQHWDWRLPSVQAAVRQGAKVVMSPANRMYLDQKYTSSTVLGLSWAGYIEAQTAYAWDPATETPGVTEKDILGVESPLWTETIVTMADIEYMIFPRLAGHAEIGWSRSADRSWDDYRTRMGWHGLRLAAMGVNFYRSPQIPWR